MDELTKLYVEITTACNLDCLMCVRRTWDEPIGHMPLRVFEALMSQVAALSSPPVIHLGGYGEPMIHPHFLGIVREAKAVGAVVEMTTNGTLLDATMAEALVALGIDRVVVSVDGVAPDTYEGIRRNGSYGRVVDNVRQLLRSKLRWRGRHGKPQIDIAFVAMKGNVADLAELPRLARFLGASQILVSNVVPHTAEMEQEILYQRSLTACAYRASTQVPAMSLPKLDLDANTLAPVQGVFNSVASISLLDASLSARNDFCPFAERGYAVVRWDGEVSPCLSLLHDHPEHIRGRRKMVTHLSLGNIKQTPLADLWESPAFVEFRQGLRAFPYSPCTTCGGCERFPANFEDCTGNGFPTCGGCLWAQGFIQCP